MPQQQAGEGEEACLARLYPDFATLEADPGFVAATRTLYGRLPEWLASQVEFQPLTDAAPLADEDSDV